MPETIFGATLRGWEQAHEERARRQLAAQESQDRLLHALTLLPQESAYRNWLMEQAQAREVAAKEAGETRAAGRKAVEQEEAGRALEWLGQHVPGLGVPQPQLALPPGEEVPTTPRPWTPAEARGMGTIAPSVLHALPKMKPEPTGPSLQEQLDLLRQFMAESPESRGLLGRPEPVPHIDLKTGTVRLDFPASRGINEDLVIGEVKSLEAALARGDLRPDQQVQLKQRLSILQAILKEFERRRFDEARAKAELGYLFRPESPEEQQASNFIDATSLGLAKLTQFGPQELRQMVGLWKAPKAQVQKYLADAGILNRSAFLDRFEQLKTVMNEFAALTAFARGGKQLTLMEKTIVFGYVLNQMDLLSPTTVEAKVRNLRQSLVIMKMLRAQRRSLPPHMMTDAQYDAQLEAGLKAAGITIPSAAPPGGKRWDPVDKKWVPAQ